MPLMKVVAAVAGGVLAFSAATLYFGNAEYNNKNGYNTKQLTEIRVKTCATAAYLKSAPSIDTPELVWLRRDLNPPDFLGILSTGSLRGVREHYPHEAYRGFAEETSGRTSVAASEPFAVELRDGFGGFCGYLSSGEPYRIAQAEAQTGGIANGIMMGLMSAMLGGYLGSRAVNILERRGRTPAASG